MTKKNKRILLYIIFGWLLFGYFFYLILNFLWLFVSPIAAIVIGILFLFAATGIFIRVAESTLREEKIDTLLDKKLKSEQ